MFGKWINRKKRETDLRQQGSSKLKKANKKKSTKERGGGEKG